MFYATTRSKQLSNGAKAVEHALAAVEIEGREDWLLDTLACAYARNGQYELAVKTQREAIELAENGSWSSEQMKGFKKRLELFEQGKPFPSG
jgi:hypothetical protein